MFKRNVFTMRGITVLIAYKILELFTKFSKLQRDSQRETEKINVLIILQFSFSLLLSFFRYMYELSSVIFDGFNAPRAV